MCIEQTKCQFLYNRLCKRCILSRNCEMSRLRLLWLVTCLIFIFGFDNFATELFRRLGFRLQIKQTTHKHGSTWKVTYTQWNSNVKDKGNDCKKNNGYSSLYDSLTTFLKRRTMITMLQSQWRRVNFRARSKSTDRNVDGLFDFLWANKLNIAVLIVMHLDKIQHHQSASSPELIPQSPGSCNYCKVQTRRTVTVVTWLRIQLWSNEISYVNFSIWSCYLNFKQSLEFSSCTLWRRRESHRPLWSPPSIPAHTNQFHPVTIC